MKQSIVFLLAIISLYSCNKDSEQDLEIPNYNPGRLLEIRDESEYVDPELTYHQYEYINNEVIDKHHYVTSPDVFVTSYIFKNEQLKSVNYRYENSNKENLFDSISYNYSNLSIVESTHYESDDSSGVENFTRVIYSIEDGKIISAVYQPYPGSTTFKIDWYYKWKGDNLIEYERMDWYFRDSPIIYKYVFEYSEIENPFFYCNIPKLTLDINNPMRDRFDRLWDLIPKCSKNFPSKLRVKGYPEDKLDEIYTFECKTFKDSNKLFEVNITRTEYLTHFFKYVLTYEKTDLH